MSRLVRPCVPGLVLAASIAARGEERPRLTPAFPAGTERVSVDFVVRDKANATLRGLSAAGPAGVRGGGARPALSLPRGPDGAAGARPAARGGRPRAARAGSAPDRPSRRLRGRHFPDEPPPGAYEVRVRLSDGRHEEVRTALVPIAP